jgi:gamma-glutamyltranspeptidase/glutathione hydrolase
LIPAIDPITLFSTVNTTISNAMTVDITKGKLEGCVVSEHTTATDIGISTLEQGGNAIDAIVATILAVGTLCPYHSDIGGSGFALVRTPDGEHHALAFRGTAPVGLPPIPRTKKLIGKDAATSKFYQDGASTQMGGSAVAVPGEIKGLKALHERYGTLAWANLVQPSIDLARDGFELHQDMYEVSLSGFKRSVQE